MKKLQPGDIIWYQQCSAKSDTGYRYTPEIYLGKHLYPCVKTFSCREGAIDRIHHAFFCILENDEFVELEWHGHVM